MIKGALISLISLTLYVSELRGAGSDGFEGQGLLQSIFLKKPSDSLTFSVENQFAMRESYRQAVVYSPTAQSKFELAANLISDQLSERDDFDHLSLLYSDPRHRSTDLDTFFSNNEKSDLYASVDRINLKVKIKRLRLTIGRTPIDFSKSYIFRPNDIFGSTTYNQIDPFHKPGVDTIQISHPIAPLGEWKLLAVAGYEPMVDARIDDDGTYIKPRNTFAFSESSLMLNYLNTLAEYSLQVTLGTYRSAFLFMGSLEGEISKSWGLRAEAKQFSDPNELIYQFSFVLGIDYRINEKNLLFGEYFLNGQGFKSANDYKYISNSPYKPTSQFGRQYLGLGIISEITPLLSLRGIAQQNLSDQSTFYTINVSYSITDKVDISLLAVGAHGAPPLENNLQSEYGSFPNSLAFQAVLRL